MQQTFPFTPRAANTTTPASQVALAVTASVQQMTLPGAPYASETSARFVVDGTSTIAWCWGSNANLTVNNGCYMLANSIEIFTIPSGITQVSVVSSGTASTLRIVVGDGI